MEYGISDLFSGGEDICSEVGTVVGGSGRTGELELHVHNGSGVETTRVPVAYISSRRSTSSVRLRVRKEIYIYEGNSLRFLTLTALKEEKNQNGQK